MNNPFLFRGGDRMGLGAGEAIQPMKAALAARMLAAVCGGGGGYANGGVQRAALMQQAGFRPQMAARPAMRPAGGPVMSVQDQIEMARGPAVIIGLDTVTTVAAAGSATVTTSPQQVCLPIQAFLTDATANNFVMTDLKIGNKSLLASVGVAVPLALFQRDSNIAALHGFPIAPGTDVSITVTNISANALRFTLGIAAVALDGLGMGGPVYEAWQ